MNLTLSIDERLVEEARKVATAMGKSLNQLIQDYLEQLTSTTTPEQAIAELRRLSEESRGNSRGWKFNRDEIHNRP
jgi:antitoxin component of RelBE/YafQ-DinJ toxin-antitoxin module